VLTVEVEMTVEVEKTVQVEMKVQVETGCVCIRHTGPPYVACRMGV
jgi:hypothetical protein